MYFGLDDSTLDKPYARQMELVTRHWSGKHNSGTNLITLMWTDTLTFRAITVCTINNKIT